MAYVTVKSPIVYYGGKTSILHAILPLIPVHETYTETFFGGGAVYFAKDQVANETINDKLDIVINFYRVLRDNFERLKRLIDRTLISRQIHNEGLMIIRAHNKGKKVDRVSLAWAFWLCTNFAYSNKIGGGYKYSNDMNTCVPDTLARRKTLFTDLLVARIEHAYIENDDAISVLKSRDTIKAFHYVDPPYPGSDQGHYKGYGWQEYEKLLQFLTTCKGKFLLSSYNSEMLDLFIAAGKWHRQDITMKNTGKKSWDKSYKPRGRTEALVWNYANTCGTIPLFDQEIMFKGYRPDMVDHGAY